MQAMLPLLSQGCDFTTLRDAGANTRDQAPGWLAAPDCPFPRTFADVSSPGISASPFNNCGFGITPGARVATDSWCARPLGGYPRLWEQQATAKSYGDEMLDPGSWCGWLPQSPVAHVTHSLQTMVGYPKVCFIHIYTRVWHVGYPALT